MWLLQVFLLMSAYISSVRFTNLLFSKLSSNRPLSLRNIIIAGQRYLFELIYSVFSSVCVKCHIVRLLSFLFASLTVIEWLSRKNREIIDFFFFVLELILGDFKKYLQRNKLRAFM